MTVDRVACERFARELAAHQTNGKTCDCGKPAVCLCSDVPNITGLVRCHKPICGYDAWCSVHRHSSNTMGYGAFTGSADFNGFVPDGPGFRAWAVNMWRRLTYSPQRVAQYVWDRERMHCPPPAPFPAFELRVGWQYFKSDGAKMVEVSEDQLYQAVKGMPK